MKKEVVFVLLDQSADWESAFIAPALNSGVKPGSPVKYEVKTLSITKDPVSSIGGLKTFIDYDVNTNLDHCAALILIGGMSWFTKESELLVPIVRKAIESNKIVGGICDASVFLGTHGFLNSVKHTSNTLEDLKKYAGENYTNEKNYIHQQAVSDKNIVTANGTGYLEFTKELLLSLEAERPEVIEEFYDFYKFGFHEVTKKK